MCIRDRAVINGKGRDTRGAGNAQALITAQMVPVGTSTQVEIITDLKISGKVAQFGRGVMQDVSTKLLGQFADCLEVKIAETKTVAPDPTPAAVAPAHGAATATAGAAGAATSGIAAVGAAAATNGAAVPNAATTPSSGAPTMATEITPPAGPSTSSTPASSASDDDDVLDLGDIGVGSALAKRAAPAAGALGALLILRWLIRRLGSSRGK